MIKRTWLSVFFFLGLTIPTTAFAQNVYVVSTAVDITTTKVSHIDAEITEASAEAFTKEWHATESIPGDRVILINSNGGSVDAGEEMLALIYSEQARHVRMICVVETSAHSMAFNILTRCDVRLTLPGTLSVVHKIAQVELPDDIRMTPQNLRALAFELEVLDETYRQANAAAMHLSLQSYDYYADRDVMWTAKTLVRQKYFAGYASVRKLP